MKKLNTNTYYKKARTTTYFDNIFFFGDTMSTNNYRFRTYLTINPRFDERYKRIYQINRTSCK